MDELLGIPEWLAVSIAVTLVILVLGLIGRRNTNNQIEETLSKRENPSRDEFLSMMMLDTSREASEFVWNSARSSLDLYKRKLAPHPDDHLVDDLPIDDEEWSMDWPRDWAEQQGFHESNLHDWPEGWPITIRNYGRWLDLGPDV